MDQDGQFVLYNAAWTNERVQKQAALEAKKQDQVRRKEAVMSAELELQRQRIEMEKQKLAYEREQLAQQKALEMERIKLEKQKQEIEAAKLQARLEEAQRQRNTTDQNSAAAENAKLRARLEALERKRAAGDQATMVAAVDRRTDSRKAARNRYKLALFPVQVRMPYGGREASQEIITIDAINRMAAENKEVELTAAYKKLNGMPNTVRRMSDALDQNEIDIWARSSIFSSAEPDWSRVRNACQKLGADGAVVIKTMFQEQNVAIDIYVYDGLSDALTKEHRVIKNWGSVGKVIEQATYKIIKDLNQSN